LSQSATGPGRVGYVLAIIIFLVGIVASGILVGVFVFGLLGLGDDLERVVVPGAERVELSETGTYTVFYEYESTVDGQQFSTGQSVPPLAIEVHRVDDGAEINVGPSRGSTTYDVGNYAGRSIASFSVDEPGTYEISAEYTDGSDGPEVVLAVGEGVDRGILTSIGAFIGGGLLFCLLTVTALVIAGFTLYRRSRANQPDVDYPP
jgi:hypothetical protein